MAWQIHTWAQRRLWRLRINWVSCTFDVITGVHSARTARQGSFLARINYLQSIAEIVGQFVKLHSVTLLNEWYCTQLIDLLRKTFCLGSLIWTASQYKTSFDCTVQFPSITKLHVRSLEEKYEQSLTDQLASIHVKLLNTVLFWGYWLNDQWKHWNISADKVIKQCYCLLPLTWDRQIIWETNL